MLSQHRLRLRQAPSRAQFGRSPEPDREVGVAEVEPDLLAERPQPVHHLEAVAVQSPTARIDAVGEPERDQVGVRADMRAVDLDVVAGVGDDRQSLRADHVGHPAGELGAAGAAGENHH